MHNDMTRLLGLTDLAVVRVDDAPHDGPVVRLFTADEQARSCPGCEVRATRMKEWVTTRPRDLPVAGRRVDLWWRKRRWHCDQPGCGRKTFTEAVDEVPARARLTDRLRRAAGAAVADGGRTIVQSARDHGLSWPVVSAAFTHHATAVLPEQPELVAVLGIDEIRRGRPQWHARVEDRIRCGKTTGLRNLPCRGYAENKAWLELSLTAADLLTWTQALCFTGDLARAEPATFRYRICAIAGKIARTRPHHHPAPGPGLALGPAPRERVHPAPRSTLARLTRTHYPYHQGPRNPPADATIGPQPCPHHEFQPKPADSNDFSQPTAAA